MAPLPYFPSVSPRMTDSFGDGDEGREYNRQDDFSLLGNTFPSSPKPLLPKLFQEQRRSSLLIESGLCFHSGIEKREGEKLREMRQRGREERDRRGTVLRFASLSTLSLFLLSLPFSFSIWARAGNLHLEAPWLRLAAGDSASPSPR